MKTQKQLNEYNSEVSVYPKYLQFFIFLKRGFYSGVNWKINYKRILCYYNRHNWHLFLRSLKCEKNIKFESTQIGKNGYNLSFSLQCRDCGIENKFEGQYRGYDEHKIKNI